MLIVDWNAKDVFEQKYIASNSPVKIWIIKHNPNSDPIFHM